MTKQITKIEMDHFGANNYGGCKAIIDGRECSFGSVVGYTIYTLSLWNKHTNPMTFQEIAAKVESSVKMSEDRKEKMVWINLRALCIHNGPRDTSYDNAVRLSTGDLVEVEGKVYQIAPDHNKNFKLIAQ